MLPGLLTPVAFAADAKPLGRPGLDAPTPARVSPFTARVNKKTAAIMAQGEQRLRADAARARADQNRKTVWPAAGTATVDVPAKGSATASPGALPVTVAADTEQKAAVALAGPVTVNVLDRQRTEQLGVKGVVLTLTAPATGAKARVGVDYGAFAAAYGGDWAGRLQVLQLPDCALSDPSAAKCRTRLPLKTSNDRAAERLGAAVTFRESTAPATAPSHRSASSPTAVRTAVLAVATGGPKSGGGDYKATPLSPASTWEAGGSSGTFTWSYPLRVPAPAAGPQPELGISYDSGSVDGRTASTNNQGTVIGEGFDITSSYVERRYGTCDDDGQTDKYDLCWKYDNASLVLNGKATELVKDDTTGTWRLKNDNASTVTHSTGADNGDDGDDVAAGKGDGKGEHWTVVTGDGVKYVFGLNKLPGATAADRTNSTWTVPVFGDDAGEPGYSSGSAFSARHKRQAWRWNLDLVEDTHGNAMTYWYTAESNHYDMLGDDNTGTPYTRGGYLSRIRYGQRADALFSATPAASHQAVFSYAERCVAADCGSLTEDTRDKWPDVPFDAECKADQKCTDNVGPTYYTRKRMTGIATQVWDAAAATPAYASVDSWALKQDYIDPGDTGDSADQSLWLSDIRHTGKRGTDLSLDPVKFIHEWRPNRVDGAADDILSLEKPRLKAVTSETGAQTIVDYLPADCLAGQTMPKADSNTRRCYPVHWSPNGEKTPVLDWFQKYPVQSVSTVDPHGGSEAVQHTYTYSGGGAWHYNEDPLVKEKERTWSVWRGFGKVTHLIGLAGKTQSKEVAVYLRGMHGDRVLEADGKTLDKDARKTAKVTGIKAPEITDSDQYAGFTRESVTYNGAEEVGGTVHDPWSRRTATQHKSYADTEAYFVRTSATHARTRVTSTSPATDRVRTTSTTFDDYGMAETVEDRGDNAVTGDEKCTRTWYARNDAVGINSLVSRTRTTAEPCATTDSELDLPADSTRPGDVVSDTALAYDTTAWSADQKPTKGEVRWTGRAKGYGTDDQPVWQKLATTTYDTLGRPLTVKDTNGTTAATTTYTPAAAGPLTATTATNAKGHKSSTVLDFATGAALKVTDPNNKITESEYDSLGRVTKVWLPNRLKSLLKPPNYVYGYHVTANGASWVSTDTVTGEGSGYNTSYEIFDSLLRLRQIQAPSPVGGRLIAETLYDERGLAVSSQSDIWDEKKTPTGALAQTDGGQAPLQTDTVFDGVGRPVKTQTKVKNVLRWTVETTYTGDTVSTTAPAGGQATRTTTNALGQTTERREYGGPQPTGTDFTATAYTYTPAGQQSAVKGPDDAAWSYGYDLFGRQTSATDPDKGKSTSTYDDLDQVVTTTDSRGRTLTTEYDALGRKTGLWDGAKSDATKLAAWTFDTLAKGQQDTAVRYENGVNQAASKAYTQKITSYDPLYQPTGSQLTLPANDPLVAAGVPQTLSASTHYNLDGTVRQAGSPAVAGLPSEMTAYTYGDLGQQLTAYGTTQYLQSALYSPQGDLRQLTLGTSSSAKKAYLGYDYEDGTRRLTRSYVTDDVHGYMPQELKFRQDDAGNVTSVHDAATLGGAGKSDYQCFTYDGHRRLKEAWTPKTADCAASGRTTANLGGAAPYWTSYTYTGAGQRATETENTTSGAKTTTYTYGTSTGQPHPLAKTTGARSATYSHDKAGNTTSRPGTQGKQTLTWNTEGKLVGTSEPAAGTKPALSTTYLYDASGELLIRRSAGDGDTVLYLGGNEVRLTVKGATRTLSGTRYYTGAGKTIAVRTATAGVTGSKLSFLAGDHHGTSSLALDATTLALTKRYTTPFGAPRGTAATTWPDDKAFLGKPADKTTGLTHIGAREYDPAIGQFISVDPVLMLDQHQSLNGYVYANNTPVTFSDPTGLCMDPGTGHCQPDDGGKRPPQKPDPYLPVTSGPSSGGANGGGGASGGGGYSGGGGGTASSGARSGSINGWSSGATYNLISQSWEPRFRNYGNFASLIAGQGPLWGIVHEEGERNEWETSRALFFGWIWGGGWPLEPQQNFRGGDAFTAALASDATFSEWRVRLVRQAVRDGVNAKFAKGAADIAYKDAGPEPGSSYWRFNTPRGVINDVLGNVTNGAMGTSNMADAFLGSYTGTGQITSIDAKNGTVRLRFTAKNTSDWNSATHFVERSEDVDAVVEHTYGATVKQNFSWQEVWPLSDCLCAFE
ncbi:type IV secretion protein Rhs [Streptomyces solincola]|uniref:Type IV secretion protein Rhs n=1 Tax=Streptomyces solincola TaxID=2100817 RepID=A0A2S9Q123_9ACTN|nr:RHS repeat-associated core domain-containing protein [Streptomyces solincola]PRH80307.1 type IV secretion protein Rhs [Streptomyces solincola]